MDFMDKLLERQTAMLIIKGDQNCNTGLTGELMVIMGGEEETFEVNRPDIKGVVSALENAFITHDWSGEDDSDDDQCSVCGSVWPPETCPSCRVIREGE